jgi:DNA-binding NarL/FixJ family response regulator
MRLIIADDSVLLREGLTHLLQDAGLEVIKQVGNAADLLEAVALDPPDVCVVDIRMPPTNTTEGLQAALQLRKSHPLVGILVLSQYVETEYAMQLLNSGSDGIGYLLKDRVANSGEFIAAVKSVAERRSVIDPTVVSRLVERKREGNPLQTITDREREVLSLIAEGRSNSAISSRLHLSPKTVETHVSSIFSKLGMADTPDDNRRVLSVLEFLRRQQG